MTRPGLGAAPTIRSWMATAALAEQQNPEDWTWTTCVVCGRPSVHRGIYLFKTDGTLGRTAWCDSPKCVSDRDSSAAFLLPADASGSAE